MTTLTQRVMRTNGEQASDRARVAECAHCTCGAAVRFETSMHGVTIEVCDVCLYRGAMRMESPRPRRNGPQVHAKRGLLRTHRPVETKRCRRCGEVKERAMFREHPKSFDGLTAKCNACSPARDWKRKNAFSVVVT